MKIVKTKEFRRNLAEYLVQATIESIYIERPGGQLLQVWPVPEKDIKLIKRITEKSDKTI